MNYPRHLGRELERVKEAMYLQKRPQPISRRKFVQAENCRRNHGSGKEDL